MNISVGAVMVTAGEKSSAHLWLRTSKYILVGLRPLSKAELEASQGELRQRELGPLAYASRDHPADIGWVVSLKDFSWREPEEADQHLVAETEAWRNPVINQVLSLGLKHWSSWRTSLNKENERLRRKLTEQGLVIDAQGNVQIKAAKAEEVSP